jgi:hypothetical protein
MCGCGVVYYESALILMPPYGCGVSQHNPLIRMEYRYWGGTRYGSGPICAALDAALSLLRTPSTSPSTIVYNVAQGNHYWRHP